jgi:hypothetical protein
MASDLCVAHVGIWFYVLPARQIWVKIRFGGKTPHPTLIGLGLWGRSGCQGAVFTGRCKFSSRGCPHAVLSWGQGVADFFVGKCVIEQGWVLIAVALSQVWFPFSGCCRPLSLPHPPSPRPERPLQSREMCGTALPVRSEGIVGRCDSSPHPPETKQTVVSKSTDTGVCTHTFYRSRGRPVPRKFKVNQCIGVFQ